MIEQKEKAFEAAATAPKAHNVTPEKLTTPPNHKASRGARPSLRAAVNAKCRSCIYDPGNGAGGWREQVQACCSATCPLHSVRPIPVKATKLSENARIAPFGSVAANVDIDEVSITIVHPKDVIFDVGRAA